MSPFIHNIITVIAFMSSYIPNNNDKISIDFDIAFNNLKTCSNENDNINATNCLITASLKLWNLMINHTTGPLLFWKVMIINLCIILGGGRI